MSSPQAPSTNWHLYAGLIIVTAIGPLALNMFMPSIPGLVLDLATTPGMAQLTLTLYLVGTAVSQLFYGPLSDRYGRRPVLLIGIVVFILASVLCALATSIEVLIIARLLQSFGGAAGMVLTRAIIRDLHDEKSSASVIGYVTMAWAVAPMAAPAIGGYLDQISGWRTSFWVLAVFGVLALVSAVVSLPETNQNRGGIAGERRLDGYKRLLGNRKFLWLVVTLSLTSGVFFAFIGGGPFIMINVLKQSPLAYGLWFAAVAVGYMTGNFFSGKFSKTTQTSTMISIGIAISLSATVVLFVVTLYGLLSPALLFVPMGFVALGNGITLPNATASILSIDSKAIGSAAGFAGFIQSAAGALVAQVVGMVQVDIPLIAIWMMIIGAVLAAGSYFFAAR